MESALQHHWQQLNAPARPPAYRGGSLVFDKKRQQLVLVAAGETWLWNGQTWSEAPSQVTPPARSTTHLTYDSTTECVLLLGGIGIDGTPLNDVWLWNGLSWTEQYPADYPPPIGGAALACDSSNQQTILFGGISGFDGVTGSNRVGAFSNETWFWNGTTWTEIPVGNPPPARIGGQLIYDEVNQQILLFGGNNATGYLNDMWLWSGTDWQPISTSSMPPSSVRTSVTFHGQLQQVMLLAEDIQEVNQPGHTYQTWLWNGTVWTQMQQQIFPGSIEGFAYDEAHGVLVACIVTGDKALLANKSAGSPLLELAAPVLASETWVW